MNHNLHKFRIGLPRKIFAHAVRVECSPTKTFMNKVLPWYVHVVHEHPRGSTTLFWIHSNPFAVMRPEADTDAVRRPVLFKMR